jgi:hypothetical protein
MKNIEKEIGNRIKSIQSLSRIKCKRLLDFNVDKLVTENVSSQIYMSVWIRTTKLLRDIIILKIL